jgi:hypothetical protein
MNCYRVDTEFEKIELGECSEDTAKELLESTYEESLKAYDFGEEAIAKTSFGIYRSEQDFLEVTSNGKDSIRFRSDRICFPSKFHQIFCLKKYLDIPATKKEAKTILHNYFQLNREEFEKKYSKHYSFR